MLTFSFRLKKKNKLGEERQAEQRKTLKMCMCVCVKYTYLCIGHWYIVQNLYISPLYTAIIFLSIAAKLSFHTGNKSGCEIELMLRLKGNSLFFLFRKL